MAYVRDAGVTLGGSLTTITGPTNFTHESGDLLVFIAYKDSTAGGNWTTPSGYTQLFNSQSGNISTACFTKVAGSVETPPSTTTTDSARDAGGYFTVIADIGGTPIDVSSLKTEGSSTAVFTPNSVTTTVNDTLLLFYQFNDTSGTLRSATTPTLLTDLPSVFPGNNVESAAGWTFQEASGTSIAPTFDLMGVETGQMYTIAISSSGTPIIPPYHLVPPSDIIHPLRGTQTAGPYGGGDINITSELSGPIGGETFNHRALTQIGQHFNGVDNVAWPTAPSSGSTTGLWGTCWSLSAGAVDLSGEIIAFNIIHTLNSYAGMAPLDLTGMLFGLRSGSGNFRFWNIAGIDTEPATNRFQSIVLEVDSTAFRLEDQGTFNSAAVDGIVMCSHKITNVRSEPSYHELRTLDVVELIGGTSNIPITFQSFKTALGSSSLLTLSNQGGSSGKQFFSLQGIKIGNGVNALHFADPNTSLEFAAPADATTKKVQSQAVAGVRGLELHVVAGNTADLSNITLSGEADWPYLVNAGSTSGAAITTDGHTIIGGTATLQDIYTAASGWTFIDFTLTPNGADLSGGCFFSNTEIPLTDSTEALLQAQLDGFANAAVSNGPVAIRISYTGTGDISLDFDAITWSNNTVDIHYNSTNSSELTAVMDNGSNATTTAISGSATGVVISAATTEITINSSETGSLIQIFTAGTTTIVASTTGNQLIFTYTGTPTFDLVIQKAEFILQRLPGELMPGADITFTINMVTDFVYDSGHGLVYNTDLSWSKALNELSVPTFGPTVRQIHSALIDAFIAESTLLNTPFNEQMNGPNTMFLIEDAEGASDSDIENMTEGGVGYISIADAITAEWLAVKSSSLSTPSGTAEFQQTDGSGTTDARASGDLNELIKIFGDASHGNFTLNTHNVLKMQTNGFQEVRVDLIAVAGTTPLENTLYSFAMDPQAIDMTLGDPGITITIVDHTSVPLVVGGKSFDFEIQDGGTNSGADIERELNYNLSLDATYQGRDPFNWPQMVEQVGSVFGTVQGLVEGISGNHGFYVSRSGLDHPDFVQFQSNDGTFFIPQVTANVTITSMPVAGNEIRLQITNETAKTAATWTLTTVQSLGSKVLRTSGLGDEFTGGLYYVATTAGTTGGSEPTFPTTVGATVADGSVVWTTYGILFQDGDPASTGFSDTYINAEEFITGDTFGIRFAELDTTTSFKIFDTTGIVSSTGFAVVVNAEADPVYAINAIDGSSTAVTDIYTVDYANNEIDLDANLDFTNPKSFAFVSYGQTTSLGMFNIWDSVTAIDAGNYRNNVNIIGILFDETAGFVKQEDNDNSRWFRSDGARPFKDPTSGGNGISMNWKNPVFTISTGSVLTSLQEGQLEQASEAQAVNTKVGTPVATVSTDIAGVQTDTTAILVDTGTTIPASIAALNDFDPATDTVANVTTVNTTTINSDMRGTDGANTVVPDNTSITAIKAKTDSLTFTKAGEVDANIQSVNDTTVQGDGETGTEWGP